MVTRRASAAVGQFPEGVEVTGVTGTLDHDVPEQGAQLCEQEGARAGR